jgi:phage tail sheath protein FI
MIPLWLLAVLALLLSALRPGTQVIVKTSSPPRTAPTDTGVWFVVGLTDAGPTVPTLLQSLDDFIRIFGGRVSWSVLYDAIDVFFREGGSSVYVTRVVGPAAVTASKNLLDAGAGISLVVKAKGPGAGSSPSTGNSLKVAVVAGSVGGTYVIQIYDSNNVLLEQSPDLTTQQDAITWSAQSLYVNITLGATALVPVVVASAALTGGADDRASITDTQWLNSLNQMSRELGPGNVSAPGRTTDVGHTQLLDHAQARNRIAFLDYPDTPTQATLTTSAVNSKTTGNGQYGGGFAPWVLVPGVVAGTLRTVPPSAAVAGCAARVDATDNANTPPAGIKGQLRYAVGLSQPAWDATARDALNSAGVNVIRFIYGGYRIYGWRSLADPINLPTWLDLSNGRYLMSLVARSLSIAENYVFAPIDGQGQLIARFGGSLTAECMKDWNAGIIYGLSAKDAFNVDVSSAVNTPTTIAANELRANVAVRPSPDAELVTVQIVNVGITQAVA